MTQPNQQQKCKHGFPLFQTCSKCGREMVKGAVKQRKTVQGFELHSDGAVTTEMKACTCIDTTEGHNLYCPLNNQLTSPPTEAWEERFKEMVNNNFKLGEWLDAKHVDVIRDFLRQELLSSRREDIRKFREMLVIEKEYIPNSDGVMYSVEGAEERNALRQELRTALSTWEEEV